MKDLIEHLEAVGLNPVVIDENTVFPSVSPFLPGTSIQYAWDSTSLGMLKTCPRLYQYTMIEGWSSQEESIHLRFGIEYHQALHDYETAKAEGRNHDEAVHDAVFCLVGRLGDYPPTDPLAKPSIRNKSRHNLIRTVIWYLDKFEDDPAETVILADGRPALEVSFKFNLDWGPQWELNRIDDNAPTLQPYILCGHLDRIVNFNSELFVMDRKTTTMTLGDYYFAQYEPNNQMTLYTIAGEIVLGSSIKGVIIDAACVQVSESKFQRGMTYRSKEQLDEWLDSLHVLLAEAEHYARINYWPMNDTACDKFGGCRFREICSKSPRVRENFLKGSFKQLSKEERWNPLKPR